MINHSEISIKIHAEKQERGVVRRWRQDKFNISWK